MKEIRKSEVDGYVMKKLKKSVRGDGSDLLLLIFLAGSFPSLFMSVGEYRRERK